MPMGDFTKYTACIYIHDSSGQATEAAATLSLRSSGLDLQNVPMYQLTVQVAISWLRAIAYYAFEHHFIFSI